MPPLPRSFYNRDTVLVARELLGKHLVLVTSGGERVGRIVEVEAYLGPHDLAAHSSKGLTDRTRIMFGPPGYSYVYLIYGVYHCMNVVTEPAGHGAAVLLRALEPVRGLATALGADPDDLYKIARCITHVRRLARRWCVPDFADGRDYLAVLYLTVLSLLPHAGRGFTQPANERWAVGLYWVLEETLDHLLGRPPFDRKQLPYDPLSHLSASWLADRDAPERVDYLCSTTDGRNVLGPVVALRGVLQGSYHHLDAYDHTLTVMAYLEELLDDPIGGLLEPARLDEIVAGRMIKPDDERSPVR